MEVRGLLNSLSGVTKLMQEDAKRAKNREVLTTGFA